MSKTVGVLALQGDFAAHRLRLEALGAHVVEVRKPGDLEHVRGLVIPGGESTTLLKLIGYDPAWWPALEAFRDRGGAFFGTCAGLILLAREVHHPEQRSLGFLDVGVDRNAWGRQVDSSERAGRWRDGRPLEVVLIRAPRIVRVGAGVEVLARLGEEPVLVAEGRVLAATFHPELTGEEAVHRLFLARVERDDQPPGRENFARLLTEAL